MNFSVEHGFFSYPQGDRQVLQDIDFSFDGKGVLAILGRNGAGKTTLLRCLLGLQKWKSGHTLLDGKTIEDIPERDFWSLVAYVPQARPSNFIYSVRDTVLLGRSARLGLFSRPSAKDEAIAEEAMRKVGVLSLADKLTSEISGGEYQLVLIARALAVQPHFIVLDEPESNLDFKNQLRVLDVLTELTATQSIGAIINTHFPAHALEISSQALLLMPDATTLYGPTKKILTEENLSKAFRVGVRIIDVDIAQRPRFACVAAFKEQ